MTENVIKPFDVVLADPNWWYSSRSAGGETKNKTRFGGGASKHYPLMKAWEIGALPVKHLFAQNCVMFMWVTMPLLYDSKRRIRNELLAERALSLLEDGESVSALSELRKIKPAHDALTVMKMWEFNYSTNGFTWIKMCEDKFEPIYGPGSFTASNAELCLVTTRGSGMMPRELGTKQMQQSVILLPRIEGVHSRKPEVHRLIDEMYPGDRFRKLEMFARRPFPGWSAWGAEVNSDIIIEGERTDLKPNVDYEQVKLF